MSFRCPHLGPGIHSLWPVTIRAGVLPVRSDLLTSEALEHHQAYLELVGIWRSCLVQHAVEHGCDERSIALIDSPPMRMGAGDRKMMDCAQGFFTGVIIVGAKIARPAARRSAQIQIFDPRAGAAMVYHPGLPFGRPLVIDSQVGAFAIFPSLVRFSISPLASGDELLLLETSVGAAANG